MYPSHQKSALQAYQRAQTSAMPPKQIEVTAFRRAAFMLKQAGQNVQEYGPYATALKHNQRLWTAIQAGLTGEACRVPQDIRSKMLDLSLFVDMQTLRALSKPNSKALTPLIEINLSMADGLAESGRRPPTLN